MKKATDQFRAERVGPTLLDRAIGWVSPRTAVKRLAARRMLQFAYRTPVANRLDRGRNVAFGFDDEVIQETLRNKARDLVDNTSIADGLVDRFVERAIGKHLRMVARTDDREWNRLHGIEFDKWSEFRADARHLTDWGGLQAAICRAQVIDGRCGCVLLKSGALQLIHGPRIATPPEKSSFTSSTGQPLDPGRNRVIDGVELDRLGAPVAFYISESEDGTGPKFTRVQARNFVYFPLLKDHWRTAGATMFRSSFDQFERVDGILESVAAATEIAAMFGVVVKSEGDSTIGDQAQSGTDSQGRGAKVFDLEPGTLQWLMPGDEIEQVKPEHPKENLRDFMREVVRIGCLPFGVPLEALLMDYSAINYSGARSMILAFDEAMEFYRERYLYFGFRRIYRWVTSKMIKDGLLPEREDAWNHRIIPSRRRWVDPEKEVKAALLERDMYSKSVTESAEERGRTRDELLDEIAEDMEALTSRGLKIVHSNSTRDPGTDEPDERTPTDGQEEDGQEGDE